MQTEFLNFKLQRLPEEAFAETEQKRRSPEGKSLLSRIKILRPPSKRRRRGRNISREIFLLLFLLLLLLPRVHFISSNTYFSSISYELFVRSWAKRSLRCCHREIRSDNLLIVLNLLFPWIISPMVSLRSQKEIHLLASCFIRQLFLSLLQIVLQLFTIFFTNSCFGSFL